jgi:hypothetical protein
LVDGPYDFAFDSRNWIDERQADPAAAGLVYAWATTPKMLTRIAGFAKLEGVWAGDGGRKNQPGIAALHGLRVLRLNGAIGDDLGFLAKLADLRVLGLESLKTSSLRGIEGLRRVECLVIDHAPRLTSLDPIAHLGALRHLSISTPASWDSSRRCIEVDTLAPLGELARLEHLTLRGVRPLADGLLPLERLKALRAVDISHVPDFGLEDFARLAGALPHAAGTCLQPHFRMNFPWPCKRCRTTQEWLTGAVGRQKRYLCPVCDKDKLAAHVAAFERIKQAARAVPSARRLPS